jgi:BirA family transcriptional regulator, biotin operon repressor / biotin---[acetyl-CoA-carboxylase] ligase
LPDLIETTAETGSTNADLLARLRGGERVVEGHWLIADRQTGGRGRQSREWLDGAGNFMGSTVVNRAAGDPPVQSLALVAGLAVREACLPHIAPGAKLLLKWPNDLLLDGAKLAGTLLEGEGDFVVIGIGVNLVAAPEIPGLRTAALGNVPRDRFAASLAAAFATELQRWRSHGLATLLSRWLCVAHPPGTPLAVHDPTGNRLSGIFDGLADDGALQLRLADGSVRTIHAGDITLIGGE